MRRLDSKVCVVTGASAGIGRTAAKLFCREGANAVAVARLEEHLKELVEECKPLSDELIWYAGDVGDPAAAVGMVKKAIADMSDEMLHEIFRINTFGLMYGMRVEYLPGAISPKRRQRKRSRTGLAGRALLQRQSTYLIHSFNDCPQV